MPALLSPKQVARAIGVSESSLKRWCDQGLIPSLATPGGHRKLPLSGVLQFLRQHSRRLSHPEAIGLPAGVGSRPRRGSDWQYSFTTALIDGDELSARQMVLDLFLDDWSLSRLADELIAPSLERIGQLWSCGDLEVYRERRACQVCLRVVSELRTLLVPPLPTARVALGGTPPGDNYQVPTALVELVLRQNGWQATSLGSSLPLATLAAAIEEHCPRLFWLSVSHLPDPAQFVREFEHLRAVAGHRTTLVVGGQALHAGFRERLTGTRLCDNLQELESFLPTLKPDAHQPAEVSPNE